jgi:hypothetical protein
MSQESNILNAAADLLAKPNGWCQGTLARDANGTPVEPESLEACSFCAIGAIEKIAPSGTYHAQRARYKLSKVLPDMAISFFNDTKGRTQDDVVAAFRKAASL